MDWLFSGLGTYFVTALVSLLVGAGGSTLVCKYVIKSKSNQGGDGGDGGNANAEGSNPIAIGGAGGPGGPGTVKR